MSTLVLAAHPDDEVLGCGGTISKRTQYGEEVYVAILGEGITSRYDSRDHADQEQLEELRETSEQVSQLLGVDELFTYDLPDNRFDTVPLLDVIKIIEGLIEKVEPSTVFTQHGGDLNIDHTIVYRAALTATRPTSDHPVKRVYSYEVASSTEWAFRRFEPEFRPNTFVDITETLETKIEAMEMYETESRSYPHPRSSKSLQAIARHWGRTAGVKAAEAFELVRSVE